ncbi:acyltransferase [Rhizobium sp. FKL33]|uniref:acyltransferase family protein n=1 Tax=Rhizobium sp. FKL33 TaxID=2562307 RepID=UPI001485AEC7|nr:acyltransferase [Rhizobium sp. FKL33]
MPLNTEEQRYHVLDGLRGVAAIAVMCGHFLSAEFRLLGHPIVPFTQSSLAVDLFFVLSGFVLCHAYAGRIADGMSLRWLMTKRFVRLYPLFITGLLLGALTLALLITAGLTTMNPERAMASVAVNLFFLPFLSHDVIRDLAAHGSLVASIFPANPPAWSLFFEMLASLALPWLIGRSTRQLAVVIALCWVGYFVFGLYTGLPNDKAGFNPSLGWSTDTVAGGFFRVGFGFALGVLLYRRLREIGPKIRASASFRLFTPGLLYLAAFCLLINPFAARGLITVPTLLVAIPAIVAIGAMSQSASARMERASIFLGYLSYPLYCLHFPVGRLTALATRDLNLSTWSFALLAGSLSILAALLAAAFIDRPLRRMIAARRHRRASQPAGLELGE